MRLKYIVREVHGAKTNRKKGGVVNMQMGWENWVGC